MDMQQLWLIVSMIIGVLLLTAAIIITLIILIYIINYVLFKNDFDLKGEKKWYEIAIAGSIILATGQLVGSLSGAMFPIWFGPDISDYILSSNPIDYSLEYNSTSNEYYDNLTNASKPPYEIFNSTIYAYNVHPLRNYDKLIYLDTETSPGINAAMNNSTIRTNQSDKLIVYTYDMSKLYPGNYNITVLGNGGDGKLHTCKVFLKIYRNLTIVGTDNELTVVRSTDKGSPWYVNRRYDQIMFHPIDPITGDFKLRLDAMISNATNNCDIKVGLTDDINHRNSGLWLQIGYYGGGTPYTHWYSSVLGRYNDGKIFTSATGEVAPSHDTWGGYVTISPNKWYSYELVKAGSHWNLVIYDANGRSMGNLSGELTGNFSPFRYAIYGNWDTNDWPSAIGKLDNITIETSDIQGSQSNYKLLIDSFQTLM